MAEKKIKWTDQQQRAIKARGSDVLVTASAGTGKTAVLSGRCVEIVSDKADVRNILVLTFTEAAAEQMRSRIAERLKDAFEAKPDGHLRYQLMLLQGADISTIHSFCKRLITEHFYKLGLDPTFSVIDSDEQKLLKAEVLEKTIDWAWQQSNLQAALEQLLYRRDLRTNDGFLSKIIHLSDFLDGVVSRQNWYERAARLAEVTNPLGSGLAEKQKQIVNDKLQAILNQLQYARQLAESRAAADQTEWLRNTHIKPVAQCIEFIKSGRWDKCAEAIRNFDKPKTYKPKGLSEPIAGLLQKTAKKAVDDFKELSQLAMVNPDYLDRLGSSVGLQTRVLVELVKKFDGLYSHAKRTLNCLDFADLEHYALRLLTEEDSTEDEPKPSETALMLREKYKHIFVDEYQDINSVQQRILRMLSPGGNILEVGDVKQSIYAFRGAQPDIFLEQLKLASAEAENAASGLRVDLNVNFRSAKGILDFVNRIFSRIMTPSFTKIDYDESAQLKPALTDEPKDRLVSDNRPVVEFHILDEADKDNDVQDEKSGESKDEGDLNLVSSRQRQAVMIARRIRQMVGADTGRPEFQIYDKQQDTFRDVQYSDIVVLMRSLAKKANDYVEVLRLAGVPVSCQATAGYFQATEISDVSCLLKVLDNPQRDIELAAVLRSPLFRVSDTELAKIKIHGRESQQHKNYYDCVLQYCRCGRDAKLAGKLKGIIAQIEQWRTIARRGNLADLVWQVYRETGFLAFVSALPNGQARRANLLKLHDRAIQFEGFVSSAGMPSLTRFVDFIERLQETGQDWAPAEPQSSAGNAVRILSVHKSKGLEFPVVFLAELESPFNKTDIQADILTDADDTLGLQIIDRQSNSKLSSLAHEVIAERKLSTALAEEMRILYVATTRARERLILTASQKQTNCWQIISNGFFLGAEAIPDWQLRSCRSSLEWVLYALSEQKSLHSAFGTGLAEQAIDDDLFSFKLYDQARLKQFSEFVLKLKTDKLTRSVPPVCHSERSASGAKNLPKRAESKLLAQVKKSLAWRYRFGDAYILPAKTSVTQLTHRNDEYIKFDYSRVLDRQPGALVSAEAALTETIEPRLLGTATHLVISELDLVGSVTEESIEKTKDKLLADNAISTAVAERIDTDSIMAFFESELGKMTFNAENTVLREWPFTFALPACEYTDSSDELRATSDEVIIVQGIIDMLVRTPQGLVIIDFKTDNVTNSQVNQRAELYRRQLDLYSRAASAILKSESIAKWLYFLTPRLSVAV
ncbi:MAG TPA: helicase-exonuclease AddAB subunit AddA [Sedimentisphaerales bacterium]|nr:helicase-exonuclease AddAB subunit AddA [Sedimentisphaerales bacterium]